MLRAVVQVALETPALRLRGLDEPLAGGAELLARLGVGERLGDQLGEAGQPLLGALGERPARRPPGQHAAPQLAGDDDRCAHGGLEPQRAQGREDLAGMVVGVQAGRAARPPDPRGDRVRRERDAIADRRLGRGAGAPAADDRALAFLEADHVRQIGAEQPPDLLGDRGEDPEAVGPARDERGDPAQRRLLLQQAPDLLGCRHGDTLPDRAAGR